MNCLLLPAGLQQFIFGYAFNQPVDDLRLPAGLQRLIVGRSFRQSLEKLCLPSGLRPARAVPSCWPLPAAWVAGSVIHVVLVEAAAIRRRLPHVLSSSSKLHNTATSRVVAFATYGWPLSAVSRTCRLRFHSSAPSSSSSYTSDLDLHEVPLHQMQLDTLPKNLLI